MERIDRAKLTEVLLRVAPGLSTREFIEQSSCFVFTGSWVATFNDEICCRTKTGLSPEFTGAVHAASMMRVLENMAGDDYVDLDNTGRELVVRGGRKRAGIRMESEILLPVESVESPAAWVSIPDDFGEAIKTVAAVAGTNDEEFLTVCVHITPTYMEACDRRQAARYTIETGVSRSFLVRAKSIVHVAERGMLKLGETDNWIHLRNRDLVFSCRRHLDEFPDIGKMLAFRGTPATLPRAAEGAAKLGGVFSGDDKNNDRVTVNLTDGHMVVRGEGSMGWASEDLEMAYRGEPVSFRISPMLLMELVKRHTDCEIGPGRLFVAGERWRYLTVLGTPEDESKPKPEPATVPAAEPDEPTTEDD